MAHDVSHTDTQRHQHNQSAPDGRVVCVQLKDCIADDVHIKVMGKEHLQHRDADDPGHADHIETLRSQADKLQVKRHVLLQQIAEFKQATKPDEDKHGDHDADVTELKQRNAEGRSV